MLNGFSPPDITEAEIQAVVDALRSGWITTGPRTKEFEAALCDITGTARVAALSSATAALETALRILGIGCGDEVITTAYTYTASASVICHVGATPVLCDTEPGSYQMNYDALAALVTPRTKAVIAVDYAGVICDYTSLIAQLNAVKSLFTPTKGTLQENFLRVPVIADAAHSLGAVKDGRSSGMHADFTAFSFHAVKNLTTAEGGALTWHQLPDNPTPFNNEWLYHEVMLHSLHGQDRDALSKQGAGLWEYDIVSALYKCNMTDIQAALGLAQLSRYDALLTRRHELVSLYDAALSALVNNDSIQTLAHFNQNFASSCHLYPIRINGFSETDRNALIAKLASKSIPTNVHYKPLPMLTAYKKLGFNIADFPNAYKQYANEITLPLHTLLDDDDINLVADALLKAYTN
ncbi:MAG: DegT/DnrJ/EryC1/StrS family aminotransferase [Coriobacteriales bacterium]|nr:DegT/DnrJ/EryC1/StrS family aminotransferase [Coriobacteriales bacterium]